ncbi:lipopolysaccharide-induced tumor necrosis factor-alpha factor homolog isoform X2 [Thalassophryne amazonica]|uniref:lipopolysaccharide-induced tumor necrosis factor-alpha factor homolog isoform X2 n=1 Tax=Thalassophryne amazonica TaxID=390379 RepID=UPI00147202BD|nr:lipopolysaccharide-induced tumor necrosis factor-alpha factor homolog isoform X2 [Thalassophryne amazonica]
MASEKSPYNVSGGGNAGDNVAVYSVHTPFTSYESNQGGPQVFTNGGGQTDTGKHKYVSYDSSLGDSPGMTTCTACQQQVMTNVTHKAGTYAWLMCLLFICCGLILCCCLIPLLMKKFKDAYHYCPRCNKLLYVNKKKCCK